MLSKTAFLNIADLLDGSPLKNGEIRRIPGMGAHFVAPEGTVLPDGHKILMHFSFDGKALVFVRKL
ncbi:hypothetical protein [Aurantiacibacter sediminis]|uniref:Uncharacterized protein n=1 Tax=Aurantiacibacter sediminis TaxID=2793064 RepID=A0ABS0N4S3_9SPHN|nr:hypothetical protein [Aurantiacibacter sediminis]MBH5322676.1 hypothetical protein [Aurantiacibacter sediminis]